MEDQEVLEEEEDHQEEEDEEVDDPDEEGEAVRLSPAEGRNTGRPCP